MELLLNTEVSDDIRAARITASIRPRRPAGRSRTSRLLRAAVDMTGNKTGRKDSEHHVLLLCPSITGCQSRTWRRLHVAVRGTTLCKMVQEPFGPPLRLRLGCWIHVTLSTSFSFPTWISPLVLNWQSLKVYFYSTYPSASIQPPVWGRQNWSIQPQRHTHFYTLLDPRNQSRLKNRKMVKHTSTIFFHFLEFDDNFCFPQLETVGLASVLTSI